MARRFLALTFLAVVAMQAATGIAPASAFSTPSAGDVGLNPDFWSGYQAGEVVPIVLPDANYPDWWTYIAAVRKSEMPRTRMIWFIINYNVGFDSAEETAATYFWTHYPTSCGVVVCGSAPAAKVRKSLAPKQTTHLDLVGKGVKGVVKVTYKGARVIL